MAKFKVGDKVNCADYGNGVVSKIITRVMPEIPYYVVFESGKELFLGEDRLTSLNRREFIVIHRDGAKTIAELRHDREVIKSGTAICNASDTFDFDTGAKLAFDRLMGREEPKPAPQPAHRFKVGDRVVVECEKRGTGTILKIREDIAIVWHEGWNGGHSCNATDPDLKLEGNSAWIYTLGMLSPAPAPEPPKFYTGKVFAVNPKPRWVDDPDIYVRNNRVYEFKDGCIIGDRCGLVELNQPYRSFAEFAEDKYSTEWREVKE